MCGRGNAVRLTSILSRRQFSRYLPICCDNAFSVLRSCWLGARRGIWPVKKLSGGVLVVVVCLERGADLHMAPLMRQRLTVCSFSFWYRFARVVPDKRPLNWCVLPIYCDVNDGSSSALQFQQLSSVHALNTC